jgi:MEDS: MEthanogen/methylotroph, DcmR Sensory domain
MVASEAWRSLLGGPQPRTHVIQLYTDDAFLLRAASHFVASGLAGGEAAVIVATRDHQHALTDALAGLADVAAALAGAQLTLVDAHACLAELMRDGRPDREALRASVTTLLDRAAVAGNGRVRLFGEMVNLVWPQNVTAAVALEAMWSEILVERALSMLCSYRINNFDRRVQRELLPQLSRGHSHLVPVEDYARLEGAVERAYRDVFGAGGDAATLRRLMVSHRTAGLEMPAAQAALLVLRGVREDVADAVLARAGYYYEQREGAA